MTEINVGNFIEQIPSKIDPDLLKGINARIFFALSGPQGGEWGLLVDEKECKITQGRIDNPQLTIKADALLLIQVLSGEIDGMRAFMMGKLKLVGDLSLAIKLMNLAKS